MGCDGGTIPRRNELVKVKKKPETKDKTSHMIFQWRYCNLTQQVLRRPIATCGLGKLYNKSSIIEAIIDKQPLPKHIKSLKDITELNLTDNPEFHEDDTTKIDTSPYICPVTSLEMSGKFRFVVVWSCGCVFAERALKEVKMQTCPTCLKDFGETDVVVLNPGEEDKGNLVKMEARKKRKRNLRAEEGKSGKKGKLFSCGGIGNEL